MPTDKNFEHVPTKNSGTIEDLPDFDDHSVVKSERRWPSVVRPCARRPALLAVVNAHWLDQARDELTAGESEIYLGANTNLRRAFDLPIETVYFKIKGNTNVIAAARFIGITEENPSTKRLRGNENVHAKYYYGVRDIRALSKPIPLSTLRYFTTRSPVPNAVPGTCIVEELQPK